MRKLLRISLVLITLLVLSFTYAGKASAQGCVVTGNTPDGGEVVNCSGVDNNGIETTNQADEITVEEDADITRSDNDAIETLGGDDFVLIKGGTVRQTGLMGGFVNAAVHLGTGNNELIMKGGMLIGDEEGIDVENANSSNKVTIESGLVQGRTDEGIDLGDGPDEVYIKGGTILGTSAAIQTDDSDDKIIITGGFIKQIDSGDTDPTIKAGADNDLIYVSHATVDGTMAIQGPIQGGDGNDTVRLGTGAVILGIMYGNSFNTGDGINGEGFDTLVFEMETTERFIDSKCQEILSKDPNNGIVSVNGLVYEWRDFDVIECELRPFTGKPIPTLSEWGLIAMAGVIGIAGVLFVIRRRALA